MRSEDFSHDATVSVALLTQLVVAAGWGVDDDDDDDVAVADQAA